MTQLPHHSISNVYIDTLDSKPSMLNIIDAQSDDDANLLLDVVDEEDS
jgi:hypothetical protein